MHRLLLVLANQQVCREVGMVTWAPLLTEGALKNIAVSDCEQWQRPQLGLFVEHLCWVFIGLTHLLTRQHFGAMH